MLGTAAILDALTDDVRIHVAVHDQPMRGKEIADFLFGVLAEQLGAVTVTDEIIEGNDPPATTGRHAPAPASRCAFSRSRYPPAVIPAVACSR